MSAPTVSVVIATHNRPELLARAIGSVRGQTYRDFEIVVVDDGTERRAADVVAGYGDERIRYIAHERNRGCAAAKNTGITHARGAFIAILDDDDAWMPEKLARQVPLLVSAPDDVGFSFHAAIEQFDHGDSVSQVPEGVGDYLDFALRTFAGMIDSAMLYKQTVFDTVGGLDETFPTHTGAEFVIRVSRRFRGVGLNEPLVFRSGGSGHLQMGSNYRNRIRGREMLLARYADLFATRPAYLAKHIERLATFYRHEGDWRTARTLFMRSFRLFPTFRRIAHWCSMWAAGFGYRVFRAAKRLFAAASV